jgi:mono/diheme cytochrome c family protein
MTAMRHRAPTLPALLAVASFALALSACTQHANPEQTKAAVDAFATVEKVFQHPRCSNCHIPGDRPLQFDAQSPHAMDVVRGPEGHGAQGLPCSTCHGEKNLPASYGAHAPPGAPHWGLPPPDRKMAWIGLPASQLCEMIKDKKRNGDRDFAALIKHVSEDKLVLWGWDPGGERAPVSVPHDQFVTAFKTWADAGGPCPG